jgi:hypothetical protein
VRRLGAAGHCRSWQGQTPHAAESLSLVGVLRRCSALCGIPRVARNAAAGAGSSRSGGPAVDAAAGRLAAAATWAVAAEYLGTPTRAVVGFVELVGEAGRFACELPLYSWIRAAHPACEPPPRARPVRRAYRADQIGSPGRHQCGAWAGPSSVPEPS